jgi:hypothetical protein
MDGRKEGIKGSREEGRHKRKRGGRKERNKGRKEGSQNRSSSSMPMYTLMSHASRSCSVTDGPMDAIRTF